MDSAALIAAVASIALSPALAANDPAELKNWFDDPYFAVSSSIAGCPVPRGPLLTKTEMEHEAHVRVERGTRCYQAGECRLPNSYRYDPEIAAHLRAALASSGVLPATSLWVTVQRRWIFIQGCVASRSARATLQKVAQGIADVEHVFIDVTRDPKRPNYPALDTLRPVPR